MKKKINRYSIEWQMERFELSREEAEEKIKKIKSNTKKWNIYSVVDQMERFGLSKEEAEEKIKNIKNVNVFSTEWQMNKFGLTKEEADAKIESIKNKNRNTLSKKSEFEKNSMIPAKVEHWIKKGYNVEEANEKVRNIIENATNNCRKYTKDRVDNPEKYKGKYDTSIEYYIKKGYTIEESIVLLKKRQSTFSLEKCIEKEGFEEGLKKWKNRQNKWMKSIENKITNEMKDSTSFNHFLEKNNGDENLAKEEYKSVFVKRYSNSKFGKASKSSMKLFNHVIKWCKDNNMKYFCGVEDSREFFLFDDINKKLYAYDFVIPELKLIFEFHGKFWHTKNSIDKENELGFSLLKSFEKDKIKRDLAIENEFILIELFEEDGFEFNLKKIFEILI